MLIGSENAELLNRVLFQNFSRSRTVLHLIGQSLHVLYDRVLVEALPSNLAALGAKIASRVTSRPGTRGARAARLPTAVPKPAVVARATRRGKTRLAS
jgi:hypothetical protein